MTVYGSTTKRRGCSSLPKDTPPEIQRYTRKISSSWEEKHTAGKDSDHLLEPNYCTQRQPHVTALSSWALSFFKDYLPRLEGHQFLPTSPPSLMAALVFALLMLATASGSDATWCICRPDLSDAALQKTLDYACGAGADCSPILQNGACYNPNTVKGHCSYAANSYYQMKGQAQGACDFAGTATLSNSDPSTVGCPYPASASSAGTLTTPATTTNPGTTATNPGTTATNPGTTTPNTFAPITGNGGVPGSLGPSGNSINTDTSNGASLSSAWRAFFALSIMFSGLALLKG